MYYIYCITNTKFGSVFLQENHWGLSSSGCEPCECNLNGAVSSQCDLDSGQCQCKAGVSGAKCDHCLPGYYGFSWEGCQGKLYFSQYVYPEPRVFISLNLISITSPSGFSYSYHVSSLEFCKNCCFQFLGGFS